MEQSEVKIGAIVHLKSGGPRMTIEAQAENSTLCSVIWHDSKGKMHRCILGIELLQCHKIGPWIGPWLCKEETNG
jgi:uncharacterized protein YodC (DUF2158 family)